MLIAAVAAIATLDCHTAAGRSALHLANVANFDASVAAGGAAPGLGNIITICDIGFADVVLFVFLS